MRETSSKRVRRYGDLTVWSTCIFVWLVLLCSGLALYIGLRFQDAVVTWIVISIVVLVWLLFGVLLWAFRRYMTDTLGDLSEMLSVLIDLREDELFSVLEDNMMSKLQAQVLKLTRSLRSRNEQLQIERDEIKSLISDIAHQLKTPLANVQLYGSFLQDEELSVEERSRFSKHMTDQVEKLSWLLESMIKLSRLESGIIQLKPIRTSVNDSILKAVHQVYEQAQQKQIDLIFEPEQDLMLIYDSRWTAEAIFNLLDNAVKYTAEGGQVTIRLIRYELFVRIDVEDSGVGMAEAELPRIFTRFYRGQSTMGSDGVGIGLYLARKITMMQDGYMKVSSQLGKGSTFSIFLPL